MSLNFVEKVMTINGDNTTPTLQFYKKGFELGSGKVAPVWRDVIVSGNNYVNLVNAKANGLNYVKLFGATENVPETYLDTVTLSGGCTQSSTPTPANPVPIVCNNGVIKVKNLFDQTIFEGDKNTTVKYTTYSIANGTYTMSSPDFPSGENEGTNIFIFAGEVTSGANSKNNGVSYGYPKTITVTDGKYTVAHRGWSSTLPDKPKDYNWQLELGSSPTTYIPYGQVYTDGTIETVTDNAGNTATATDLLAIGDVKDTQEVLSGNVTKRFKVLVLDGTEDWVAGTSAFTLDDAIQEVLYPSTSISTHFLGKDNTINASSLTNNSFKVGASNYRRRIYIKADDYSTLADFKQYLADQFNAGTPVIVVYPLASATTETVSAQVLTKSPVTQTAGSINDLPIAYTESSHTTPKPDNPLDIRCNNGVIKARMASGLPLGYKLLDYISTSTGSIDIGISGDAQFNITAEVTSSAANTQTLLNSSSISKGGCWYGCANGKWAFGVNAGNYSTLASDSKQTAIITFDSNGASGTVGEETISRQASVTQGDWYLFRYTSIASYQFKGRLYSCTVTQNNVVVRNFLPCKNSSDVVGLYDLVSGQFFTADSGTINAGSEITDNIEIYIDGIVETVQDELNNTATATILNGIDTYKDVQEVLTGNVTRNVGVVVFDGTESWETTSGALYYIFAGIDKDVDFSCFCTHYIGASPQLSIALQPDKTCKAGYRNNPDYATRFYVKDSTFGSDTTAFKQFLSDQYSAGTPVIVIYPLATATTSSVTPQTLTTQQGTNTIEITQASIDSLPLEVSYKAGVAVTITEVQNAQLDNNVEVTING